MTTTERLTMYNYDRRSSADLKTAKYRREDPEEEAAKAQRGMAGTVEMGLRGLKLSGPSMKAVQGLKRDLLDGKAQKRDVKEIMDDMKFDIKNEVGGKRNVKKIQELIDGLKRIHDKL